jgi:hypothetical protein
MEELDLWSDEAIAAIEAEMSDKQKKQLNFLVGKTMGELKQKKLNYDPKHVRAMIIKKIYTPLFKEEVERLS